MERKIEQKGILGNISIDKDNENVCITQETEDCRDIVIVDICSIPPLITILQQFIGNEGKCYECKRDVVLAQDYNGRNYLLCTSCLDKLNKEFDE